MSIAIPDPDPALWLTLSTRAAAYRAGHTTSAGPASLLPDALALGAFPILWDLWAVYVLRPDGTLFLIGDDGQGEPAPTVVEPPQRWLILAAAARSEALGLPELRRLLPARPPTAADCPSCAGTGTVRWPTPDGTGFLVGCPDCAALGWLAAPQATDAA